MTQSNDTYAPDKPTIYRFKLDLILGRGGSGCVYRGLDPQDGKVVAIKLFYKDFFRSKMHLMDFTKSVQKFRKFSHPSVMQVYEMIDGKEGVVLVMEFVDGADLKWYITNRAFDLRERLVIVAQVCNGLQYIHDQGFTHHDLKPSNVLLTRRGVVKLADYSLLGASVLAHFFDASTHEQVTPLYVAPELIRREKATPRSDIYSLGIMMYQMFAGKSPFEVDNLQMLYQCHLRVIPVHPTQVNNKCPQQLGDIIMKMIDKKPENRFQDCDQIRIAMQDIGRSRI